MDNVHDQPFIKKENKETESSFMNWSREKLNYKSNEARWLTEINTFLWQRKEIQKWKTGGDVFLLWYI